ncbi:MAG TPA: hypothetical protein ENJ28_03070 [Gammaproteobacteria bacterium]|nr:hypothetical protein [Gammaproteobacteria bacterium]
MSITKDLIFGLAKGLTGKDLESMPRDIGEWLGRTIVEPRLKNQEMRSDVFAEFEKKIAEEPQIETEVLKAAIGVNTGQHGCSLLHDYVDALNIVISFLDEIKRPIVLSGFLHSEECLSYWHIDDLVTLLPYEVDGEKIRLNSPIRSPSIYILETKDGSSSVEQLNDEIRRSQDKALPGEFYTNAYCVQEINEFQVLAELKRDEEDELPDLINGNEESKSISWCIPDGAYGLLSMISSIPLALDAQSRPEQALNETMKKIKEAIK